ncbi:hypothetical protein KXD40_007828 [Peronospora effusa]|nr:hypothetical protein KXD40_007828 [Peronospora effusa]
MHASIGPQHLLASWLPLSTFKVPLYDHLATYQPPAATNVTIVPFRRLYKCAKSNCGSLRFIHHQPAPAIPFRDYSDASSEDRTHARPKFTPPCLSDK